MAESEDKVTEVPPPIVTAETPSSKPGKKTKKGAGRERGRKEDERSKGGPELKK